MHPAGCWASSHPLLAHPQIVSQLINLDSSLLGGVTVSHRHRPISQTIEINHQAVRYTDLVRLAIALADIAAVVPADSPRHVLLDDVVDPPRLSHQLGLILE